ncbi:MAG: complex I NDUFA9 subunit family protein, partial [Limnobacter sp.]|nr:complex I NDUFA9 subunit family protein [Limnobacter sp.]
VFPLAGAETRFQPVAVQDVSKAVRLCLTTLSNETIHNTFDLAGPETFSLADLVRLSARAVGKNPLIVPLPTFVGKMQAFMMECMPGQPLMSRDNVDSMSINNVVTTGKLFPLGQYISLSAYAPDYLKARFSHTDLDNFRQSAHRRG